MSRRGNVDLADVLDFALAVVTEAALEAGSSEPHEKQGRVLSILALATISNR